MKLKKLGISARKGRLKKVVFTLVFSMALAGMIPNLGGAAVIPADEASSASAMRADNMAKIRATLEREEVAARLGDYGLTPAEVEARMDSLSDQQVAELAGQVDRINAGGDAVGTLVSIALLVLLVLLILHLLGYIDLKLPRPKAKKQPSN